MKKLALMLGLACMFMVGCGGNTDNKENQPNTDSIAAQQQQQTPEVKKEECPMHALKDQFANWDNMDQAAKEALVADAAKILNDMKAQKEAEMKEKGEECCKDMPEEMKAQCEEMKKAWENFDNLDLDAKKDLIMKNLEGCGGEKGCCNHEGEQPATK